MELILWSTPTSLVPILAAVENSRGGSGMTFAEEVRLFAVAVAAATLGGALVYLAARQAARRRQKAVRESATVEAAAQLRSVLEHLVLPCWTLDAQERFTFVNAAAQPLLGGGAELCGRGLDSCQQPAEVRLRWGELNRRALRGERVQEAFTFFRDGWSFPGFQWVTPLQSHGAVSGLAVVCLDLTDRVNAERDRDLFRLRLAQHLRQAPLAMIEWDIHGLVKVWNPMAEVIFGYTEAEARGKSAASLIVPEEQRSAYLESWKTLVEQKTPLQIVLPVRTKSGGNRVCEWSSSPLLDEADRVTGVTSCAQEITGRLEMEARVKQSLHLESMGRLAAGVAHEFNNLLAPMVIEVERIASHLGDPARIESHVNALRTAVTQAKELTERAQLIAGREPEKREWLDLAEVVNSWNLQLRGGLDPRIRIELTLDRTLPPLSASRGALVQILNNLIFNARDAFPVFLSRPPFSSWQPVITITTSRFHGANPGVSTRGDSFYQVITVRDNGPGLSAEAREHAFEPFFTTKSPGSGRGLGLALVWRLAQNHDGWITLHSEEGQGCELRVFLPEQEGEGTALSTSDVHPAAAPVRTDRRPGLLLVEDNLLVANALAGALEDRGYRVFSAESGERAWELLTTETENIDLGLCDLNLPGISGRELLQKIQSGARPIPVVMMSGYVGKSDTEELNRIGATALISKPIDPQELFQIVTRIAPIPA